MRSELIHLATGVKRDTNGNEPLEFRLTMGLRKIDAKWRVLHEHHSLPAA
jgi:ketosteroid isomerase-like protein